MNPTTEAPPAAGSLGGVGLNKTLFHLGGVDITAAGALAAVGIVVAGIVISRLVDKGIERTVRSRLVGREGAFRATRRVVRYAIISASLGVAMNTLGIDVSALFTAGAIFAVGIGFAMQTIAQNFVSGAILLVERSIKTGDILKVDGQMVRVEEIGIRSTIARTREDEEVIIPNSSLVQSTVTNYSLHDSLLRLRCVVGVTYSSDMRLVKKTLEGVASRFAHDNLGRTPSVFLRNFGSSSVDWEVSIWIDRPWDEGLLKGDLFEAIWFGLKERDIVIAFPQLDVHFDAPPPYAVAGPAPSSQPATI